MAAGADPSSGFDCSVLAAGLREGLWVRASDDQGVGLATAVALAMSHDARAAVDCNSSGQVGRHDTDHGSRDTAAGEEGRVASFNAGKGAGWVEVPCCKYHNHCKAVATDTTDWGWVGAAVEDSCREVGLYCSWDPSFVLSDSVLLKA